MQHELGAARCSAEADFDPRLDEADLEGGCSRGGERARTADQPSVGIGDREVDVHGRCSRDVAGGEPIADEAELDVAADHDAVAARGRHLGNRDPQRESRVGGGSERYDRARLSAQ